MYLPIIRAIKKSGTILRNGLKSIKEVELKGKQGYLTNYDIVSEKNIISAIKRTFPSHFIHGEETGLYKGSTEFHWYIDPLSETGNFIHNLAGFAISVGLVKNKTPIFGIVYDPILDEMFIAEKSKGAFCNNEKIKPSKVNSLEHALISVDWEKRKTRKERNEGIAIFTTLAQKSTIRIIGSIALTLCYIASGRLDAMVNNYSDKYSLPGAFVILKEAGGELKNLRGEDWVLKAEDILATNGKLTEEILNNLPKNHLST